MTDTRRPPRRTNGRAQEPTTTARTQERDPNLQLELVLHAVSRLLERTFNDQCRQRGLNQSQAALLMQVDHSGELNQTQIAERLGIGKVAAGTLIADLEGQGLLRRTRDRNDGRAFVVTVTPAGHRKVKGIDTFWTKFGAEARGGIPREDIRTTLSVLDQLRNNLIAMNIKEPFVR